MADGVTFQSDTLATPPEGTEVAADDTAEGKVQLVKLAISTDGSATLAPVSATDGALVNLGTNNDVTVAALPLPSGASTSALQGGGLPAALGAGGGVKVDGSGTSLPVTEASASAAAASLSVLDDWDESDRAKVNPIAGQAGVQGGSGAVSALTQRVVLATDVALPAGTNAIGTVGIPGTATNAAAQVTVTNSSTTIIASRSGRRGVLVVNQQTVAVYVDPSGGTAATTHFRLDPGASIFLPVTSAITGITSAAYTASGDAKVHYFEAY